LTILSRFVYDHSRFRSVISRKMHPRFRSNQPKILSGLPLPIRPQ
jgi:hypothetical protein